MQKETMEEALRGFAAELPGAMREAWQSYKDSQHPDLTEKEIKKMKLRQDAGKAAMAHMMLILKATKTAGAMDGGGDELAGQIEKAEAEINEIRQQQKRDE
ncbi:MAG: hypothetical protein DYH13_06900 [Alphaproteobacteria bacterium PRO2]|nr:hypothetical protein [Alphaproteobacteria bacterium PRO2]